MALKAFDRKFGPEFLSTLSTGPGIYRVFSATGQLIYVGKAKNIRRRLSQYRNAKRRKRHFKMRKVVEEADRIEVEPHLSELDACLAEARVIQEQRPKWNVAGAFYFLYPMIGVSVNDGAFELIYTTEPEVLDPAIAARFSFHGAFRSRSLCGDGFFALVELLEFVGHKNKTQKLSKHTYHYSFRQIPDSWPSDFELFFKGESTVALEKLILALVESGTARKKSKEVQKLLNELKRFWRHEAVLLNQVRTRLRHVEYPVPQKTRDILFVENRYGNRI
jgi:hypothetical protein